MANDEVTRVIALRFGGEINDSNAVAAMPSLHVAFPALLTLWFIRESWRVPALLMGAYTAIIGFEVVFSGEHYVVDVLGGIAIAVMVSVLMRINWAVPIKVLLGRGATGPYVPEGPRVQPAHGATPQPENGTAT
jgi:hypothetical protein